MNLARRHQFKKKKYIHPLDTYTNRHDEKMSKSELVALQTKLTKWVHNMVKNGSFGHVWQTHHGLLLTHHGP